MKISQEPPEVTSEIYNWVSQMSKQNTSEPPVVLAPIPTLEKEYGVKLIYNLKKVYCTVFPWLEGKTLKHCLSVPNMERWGELMAKIHKQSQDSAAELASSHLRKWNKVFYWEPLRITSEVKHLPAEDQRIFEQMTQRVSEALSTLWQGASPIRIHGDLHPNNVKVHKKQLVAFDFDDAMWGFPIQDIAIALTYLRHNPRFPAFLDAFRQGYTKHAQWPEAHPGHLETFFMGRLLWMANAVLDNENAGSEKDDDEESFKDRLARYIDEFKTVLEN